MLLALRLHPVLRRTRPHLQQREACTFRPSLIRPRCLGDLNNHVASRFFHRYRSLRSSQKPQFAAKKNDRDQYIYPEKLLIYNAGTRKTSLIGLLKISNIVCFSYFTLSVAPALFQASDQPWWTVPGAIILGAVPMILVGYITSPFVNSIYVRLPAYARVSKELLWRYTTYPPNDAVLDIKTIRLAGNQRSSTVKISDLRPLPPRYGRLANFERRNASTRPQSILNIFKEPRNKFYVGNLEQGMRATSTPGVLTNIITAIYRNR